MGLNAGRSVDEVTFLLIPTTFLVQQEAGHYLAARIGRRC